MDRDARIVRVCKRYPGGLLKPGTKTVSERFVPLRQRVLDALDAMPTRIDTRIFFPAPRGGYIDINKFRHREWTLRAAGVPHRTIHTMRHTFATWAIEEGSIPLPRVATIMGTSIRGSGTLTSAGPAGRMTRCVQRSTATTRPPAVSEAGLAFQKGRRSEGRRRPRRVSRRPSRRE